MTSLAVLQYALFCLLAQSSIPETNGLGTSIIVAGKPYDVGKLVVLWSDDQGFDGYQKRCVDQTGGCCDEDSERYGVRKGLKTRTIENLQELISQFVLHFDGCVNSRSCFKSMHNRTRPGGGCGLSAHFMIDTDGTIYQTMDLLERAYHAEQVNSISIGVEICNRGRYNPGEMSKLPREYQTRPHHDVVINGFKYNAYEFRAEQYDALVALTKTLLRLFPKLQPAVPEKNGEVDLNTLEDPMGFRGILGHLHVDLQKQKWDPGALNWRRILRQLQGLMFPVQIGAFLEIPAKQEEMLVARRAAFKSTEERVSGHFPVSPGRLFHSGVHLAGKKGSLLYAPARGRILAVRRGSVGEGSNSFLLVKHDVDVKGETISFYSLVAHLSLPMREKLNTVPWLLSLERSGNEGKKQAYLSGKVVLLNEQIEMGDVLGLFGEVSRGPESGSEIHYEIFTVEKLPSSMERNFRYLNAVSDGPVMRRSTVISRFDLNGDEQVDDAELRKVFRGSDVSGRQSLRRVAIRHRHEWGDRTTEAEFMGVREFSGLAEQDRRKLYRTAIAPYVFWTDALSAHAGLPQNQIIYSYNPIAFLMLLNTSLTNVELPWPKDGIADGAIEPRRLPTNAFMDWFTASKRREAEFVLPTPVGADLRAKKKAGIPLIELPATDHRD